MRYHETKITVRFCEIDAYRVAWHGHYVAWMEIGRNALAGKFDMDAFQLAAAGYLGPVIGLELKFLRPASFNDELTILTGLRRTRTATLEFITVIVGPDGKKCATGVATHALTDLDGVLQFQVPQVLSERIKRLYDWLEVT
jgi:acyl-CoA thioester hydrolase